MLKICKTFEHIQNKKCKSKNRDNKENLCLEIVKKVILIIKIVREFENTKDESLIFTSQYLGLGFHIKD